MIKFALLTLALLACTASASQGGCRGATNSMIVFACNGNWDLWTVLGEGGQTVQHSPNNGNPDTYPEDNNPGDVPLNGWPTLSPQIDGSAACGAACNSERQFNQQLIMSPEYNHCPANLKAGGADFNNLCSTALMKTRITGTNAAHTILGFKYESVFWNAAIGFLPTGFVTGVHTTTDGGVNAAWHGMMTWPWEFLPNLFDKISNSLVAAGQGRLISTQGGLFSQQVQGGPGRRQIVDVVDVDEEENVAEQGDVAERDGARGGEECGWVGGICDCTAIAAVQHVLISINAAHCESTGCAWTDTAGGGGPMVNHKRGITKSKGGISEWKDAGSACKIEDGDFDGRP